MDLTNPRVKELAKNIYDMHFAMNSLLDNVNNYLAISCNMPNFADFVHEVLSHEIPLFGDEITDFGKKSNTRIGRGAVPANEEEYDSPINATKRGLDYAIEMNNTISKAIDECISLNQKNWEDFFRDYENRIIMEYVYQCNKFYEAIMKYADDNLLPTFNKDFGSFITPFFRPYWVAYLDKNNND